jgi:hypothetical protein
MHLDSSAVSFVLRFTERQSRPRNSPHPVLRSTEASRYVFDKYVRLKCIDNSSIP